MEVSQVVWYRKFYCIVTRQSAKQPYSVVIFFYFTFRYRLYNHPSLVISVFYKRFNGVVLASQSQPTVRPIPKEEYSMLIVAIADRLSPFA